jgi:hypothetical protein
MRKIAKMLGAKSFKAHTGDGTTHEDSAKVGASVTGAALAVPIPGSVKVSLGKSTTKTDSNESDDDIKFELLGRAGSDLAQKLIGLMDGSVQMTDVQKRERWERAFRIPANIKFFPVTERLISDRIEGAALSIVSDKTENKDSVSVCVRRLCELIGTSWAKTLRFASLVCSSALALSVLPYALSAPL